MSRPVLVLALALASLAAVPAVAQDDPGAAGPPTATADSWSLVPTLQTEIPVLANDTDPSGDPLQVVSHTAPAHGSVTCGQSTCTYVPPARKLPGPDSDAVLAPEQPDSFTYTVADSTAQQATALVTLVPVVPRARTKTVRPRASRCTRSRRPASERPLPTGSGGSIQGPSPGGTQQTVAYVSATCRRPAHHAPGPTQGPPSTPQINGRAVPVARSAASGSFVSGLRWGCSFADVGSQGIGQFGIRGWIGENGSTGVNRMTFGYRVQIHGRNFLGQGSWVTVNATSIAANLSYPDSYSTWLPASRDYAWLNVPWGNASYAAEHGPFRLQVRAQWLKRHFYGDTTVRQDGWVTPGGCQGQPSLG